MAKQRKWKLFKGSRISTEPILPRVWQRQEGGHVVRARVVDKTTGRQREVWKVLPQADAPTALKWIEDECKRVRAGVASVQTQRTRFCDYATSLSERKIATKEIMSASGRERWRYTLEHLIAGTESVAGFGDIFIDELRRCTSKRGVQASASWSDAASTRRRPRIVPIIDLEVTRPLGRRT